ncbi:MAG: DUF2164 domain-containing protein [Oscillospiraceae bacterium]|nr:DUF2164 domain-containing protein [Oscillospiraceae bacterium]
MRKKDKKGDVIPLTKEQKSNAINKIKEYAAENFEIEIGNLQVEIFLDFITKNIGIYYYNQAVADSLSFMTEKANDLYLLMKDEEEN